MTHTTKHTPGPWSAHYNNEGLTVFSPDNVPVAYVDYDECEERPVEANAHLITAAPTMHRELETVREYLLKLYDQGNSEAGQYAASIDTTLAQAEGTNR